MPEISADANNLPKVVLRLETYEERVALHAAKLELKQQETIQKMKALGFTDEEIAALSV